MFNRQIMLLSVAGPETSIKATRAHLSGDHNFFAHFDGPFRVERYTHDGFKGKKKYLGADLVRSPHGYRHFTQRLGYNTYHMVSVAMDEGFIPVLNETALELALQMPRYTTPFIREWVPWMAKKLCAGDRHSGATLEVCDGCQTFSGMLYLHTDGFDELVSSGLRNRHLTIPRRVA